MLRRWGRRQVRYAIRMMVFATFGGPVFWYFASREDMAQAMQRLIELFPSPGP